MDGEAVNNTTENTLPFKPTISPTQKALQEPNEKKGKNYSMDYAAFKNSKKQKQISILPSEILEENQEIKVYNTIDSSTNRESCLPVILHNKEKRQQNSQIISPIDLLKVKSNYQYYVKRNTLNINEHYYVNRRTQKRCISKLTNLYDFIV